jgi:hypothetical protein
MYIVNSLTDDPVQIQNLVLYDGSVLNFQMRWIPRQLIWVFDSMTWGTGFNNNGMRVYNSPNMLRQWKNLLTFGLACVTTANREPSLQADFSSGNSTIYILNSAEVQVYEAILMDIPIYNSTVSYYIGNKVYNSDGVFISLQNFNLNNPVTDTEFWNPSNA